MLETALVDMLGTTYVGVVGVVASSLLLLQADNMFKSNIPPRIFDKHFFMMLLFVNGKRNNIF